MEALPSLVKGDVAGGLQASHGQTLLCLLHLGKERYVAFYSRQQAASDPNNGRLSEPWVSLLLCLSTPLFEARCLFRLLHQPVLLTCADGICACGNHMRPNAEGC